MFFKDICTEHFYNFIHMTISFGRERQQIKTVFDH